MAKSTNITDIRALRRNDHPDTSHAAALTVRSHHFETLALEIITEHGVPDKNGNGGCIADQLREGFARRAPPKTQFSNRRTGIHQQRLVIDTGLRRVGESGRRQAVYCATSLLSQEWIDWILNEYPKLNKPYREGVRVSQA